MAAGSFVRRLNPALVPASSTAVDHPGGTTPGFIGASAASHKPPPGDFSLSSYQNGVAASGLVTVGRLLGTLRLARRALALRSWSEQPQVGRRRMVDHDGFVD